MVEEVDREEVADMVGEERRVCDGRRFESSRETVRSAKSMPSFNSSPWILGAPQKRFVTAILLMRAAVSALIGGRPSRGRPDSPVQCSRKRRLCHRRTVLGDTMTRAFLQPAQTVASPTHKRRSVVRSLGRGTVRLYTTSCWRRARFSRVSWRWPPKRKGRSRSRWSRRVIIELRLWPDQNRQINHLTVGQGFGEGQAADRAAKGASQDAALETRIPDPDGREHVGRRAPRRAVLARRRA